MLQQPTVADLGAHTLLVEPVGATPLTFGPIEGRVGMIEQARAILGVIGVDGNPYAGGDQRPAGRLRLLTQRLEKRFREAAGRHRMPDPCQNGEFVAAEPGHELRFVQYVGDDACNILQQPVAHGVAEQVVDLLESVEIEPQDRKLASAGSRYLHLLFKTGVEAGAIGQAGEPVVHGEKADLHLRPAPFGQVADGDGVVRLAGVLDRPHDQLDRDRLAAGTGQLRLDRLR